MEMTTLPNNDVGLESNNAWIIFGILGGILVVMGFGGYLCDRFWSRICYRNRNNLPGAQNVVPSPNDIDESRPMMDQDPVEQHSVVEEPCLTEQQSTVVDPSPIEQHSTEQQSATVDPCPIEQHSAAVEPCPIEHSLEVEQCLVIEQRRKLTELPHSTNDDANLRDDSHTIRDESRPIMSSSTNPNYSSIEKVIDRVTKV